MAMAVESAATRTEVRLRDAARLREARRPSAPRIFCRDCAVREDRKLNQRGNRVGCGDDEKNGGEIAEERLAGDGRKLRGERGGDGEKNGDDEIAGLVHLGSVFAAAARHGVDRRDQHCFARWRKRRQDGNADANQNGESDELRSQVDGTGTTADVEGFNGERHQLYGARSHKAAKRKSKKSAGQAEAGSFAKKGAEDSGAATAESAHNPDFVTATNDGNGNCVVDEESADDQGDITEQTQIPAEGSKHFTIFVGGGALRVDVDARGQDALNAL